MRNGYLNGICERDEIADNASKRNWICKGERGSESNEQKDAEHHWCAARRGYIDIAVNSKRNQKASDSEKQKEPIPRLSPLKCHDLSYFSAPRHI